MGFYMLHESMLDSVIMAGDKFLKPDGLMFLSHCALYASPCALSDLYSEWDNVCGVKMRSFAQALRSLYLNRPKITSIEVENVLSRNVSPIAEFNLKNCQPQQLDKITAQRYITIVEKSGIYQGVCFWFDVQFPTTDTTLSASPTPSIPHWKQTTHNITNHFLSEKMLISKTGASLFTTLYYVDDRQEKKHIIEDFKLEYEE